MSYANVQLGNIYAWKWMRCSYVQIIRHKRFAILTLLRLYRPLRISPHFPPLPYRRQVSSSQANRINSITKFWKLIKKYSKVNFSNLLFVSKAFSKIPFYRSLTILTIPSFDFSWLTWKKQLGVLAWYMASEDLQSHNSIFHNAINGIIAYLYAHVLNNARTVDTAKNNNKNYVSKIRIYFE